MRKIKSVQAVCVFMHLSKWLNNARFSTVLNDIVATVEGAEIVTYKYIENCYLLLNNLVLRTNFSLTLKSGPLNVLPSP